ncbi:hypothetical protein IT072_01590 [Leifsonia sp. ZF2019]|uniref:nSTAND3 domain-containing NTPase n=1 Tax=Leifsonia sp. ZF2019 TaxID=2781978 RepID=UPI001CC084BC|nr:hypothetical protein [Leifsonia sp. ZF2019]UAJ79803.1 hypothetical protein IT072_01590 [Leifsonia sp. ZF2019]
MADYDFRSLSPIDFESFTRDLLNAALGIELVSFGVGPDGGVDLRDAKRGLVGQSKHYPDADRRRLIAAAKSEAKRGLGLKARDYLFITSAAVSPETENLLLEALTPLPVQVDGIWHRGRLNAHLAKHRDVENRHYKLWLSNSAVFQQVAEGAQWQRSEALLRQVRDRAKLFVPTEDMAKALAMLDDQNVVIISGSPGVGKSTLAQMILLAYWREGWTIRNIASDVDDAWRHHLVDGEKTLYFYDDFLGQTNVAELQKNEASNIALLIDDIRNGSGQQRLILTTRQQVLNAAQTGADDRVRRLAEDRSRIRIELKDLSRSVRAQMLFNHLYFGFPDRDVRLGLATDTRYRKVIDHPGFNPRLLESVAIAQHHDSVDDFYTAMFEALNHPETVWSGSYRQLSTTAVAVLNQLAVWPSLYAPLDVIRSAVNAPDPRDLQDALKTLEGSWIRLEGESGRIDEIALYDPSRRDFLLDQLQDPGQFDATINAVVTVGQLNYVLSLANLQHRQDGLTTSPNPVLEANARRRIVDLDAIAAATGRAQLEHAARVEAVRQVERDAVHKREGYFLLDNLAERVDATAQLALFCSSALFDVNKATDQLRASVDELLSRVDNLPYVSPSADLLFDLASRLADRDSPAWSHDAAMKVLRIAFEAVPTIEDLQHYLKVPRWFRDERYRNHEKRELAKALENELEAISQQSDPELMSQWLGDVIAFAEATDIDIHTDTLRERIDEMDAPLRDPSGSPQSLGAYRRDVTANDEDLAAMFAKLKS